MSTPKVHSSVLNTQVLSVRIQKNTLQHIDKLCKQKGINRSQWIADTITKQYSDITITKLKRGGGIQKSIVDDAMPEEIQKILVGAGIVTLGAIVFDVINTLLKEEKDYNGNLKFTDKERKLITMACVAALGMGAYGIFKHISSE